MLVGVLAQFLVILHQTRECISKEVERDGTNDKNKIYTYSSFADPGLDQQQSRIRREFVRWPWENKPMQASRTR